MSENHTAARAVDFISSNPRAREPFDPADLLAGRQPPPAAYVPGPPVEVVREFDPANFLGARALRGAFNLATVKPLVTTIGGVEMVTVPASAYADALRRVMPQEMPMETVERAGPVLDGEGCLSLLIRLHEAGTLSIGQVVEASGLDHLDVGDRIAAHRAMVAQNAAVNGTLSGYEDVAPVRFVPSPEAAPIDAVGARVAADAPEAHGAALDLGHSSEAHGAALDQARSERHPRKAKATREVP